MTPGLRVARAVLWEGYSLYPYRPSSLKNRHRLLFGTLVPPRFADPRIANDPCAASMEGLLAASADATMHVIVRFLRFGRAGASVPAPAVEHAFALDLGAFLAERDVERVLVADQTTENGVVFPALTCRLTLTPVVVAPGIHRVRVEIANLTDGERESGSLGGAHVVLRVENGGWISLLDPPLALVGEAARCERNGLNPVLLGARGERHTLLGSPIILDDHPEVAAESHGDLYDATEIEEILTLRVQTLSAAERAELASGDAHVRALLDRVDGLTREELERMHGALRSLPARDDAGGSSSPRVTVGDRVRVRPLGRADALDVLLAGLDATVIDVEQTVDGGALVCVTIDCDPGKDLGDAGFPGHRFMFRPEELERLP